MAGSEPHAPRHGQLCGGVVSVTYPADVPTPRSSQVRGWRITGDASARPGRPTPRPAQTIADPARPRDVVNHALAKRRVLSALRASGPFVPGIDGVRLEHLEADPYLMRAARHHGLITEAPCPVCARGVLRHVMYVYGDDLGEFAGRVRTPDELTTMAYEYGQFDVYVVEVCLECSWNHLHLTYRLGDGRAFP